MSSAASSAPNTQPLQSSVPSLAQNPQNLSAPVNAPEDVLERQESAEDRRERQCLDTRVSSARPTRQSESEESAHANTENDPRSRRGKRGLLNGLKTTDPWYVRLIIGGPWEFIPGVRDVNPSGIPQGWTFRALKDESKASAVAPTQVDTVLVDAVTPTPEEIQAVAAARGRQRDAVFLPPPPAAENSGSAFLPGAGAAPSKVLVDSPQKILEGSRWVGQDYFLTTGGVELDGEGFFGDPILDEVFRFGKGRVAPAQSESIKNIRKYYRKAYDKSPNFKAMVMARYKLIKNKKAPRITIAVARNSNHFKAMLNITNLTIGAKTFPHIGVVIFNADYLKNNPIIDETASMIVIDTDKEIREKPMSGEDIALHESMHALTYSADLGRSTPMSDDRFALANGGAPSSIPPQLGLDWPRTGDKLPNNWAKIPAGTIPGINIDVYINTKAFSGETFLFTNTIMQDIYPNYRPTAVYNSFFVYDSNNDHANLLSDEYHIRVLKYLIYKDGKDGRIDYPYLKFDANRQRQVNMDAERIRSHYIQLSDNYFAESGDSPHTHEL